MDANDARLEIVLREAEYAIGDDGFTDLVMSGLPKRRLSRTSARRITLGAAAIAGSVLTSVLGAPLETAFSSLVLEGVYGLSVLAAVALFGIIAIPIAWVFYSR